MATLVKTVDFAVREGSMLNSLLSLPAVVGECFRSLNLTPILPCLVDRNRSA